MSVFKVNVLYAILEACICGMAFTGFTCEEKGCEPLCQDNDARLCLLIDDKQYCECQCGIGDIVILLSDPEEPFPWAFMKKVIPQYSPRFGAIDWCSNNDVPTCRPIKVHIQWFCADIGCLDEGREWYPAINPQVIDPIPCGQSRALYVQFACGTPI